MSIAATRAPSRTKRSTPARPIPDAAAVTMASLPFKRIVLSSACKGIGKNSGGRDDGGLGLEKGIERLQAVLAAPAARIDAALGGRTADVEIGVDPAHARLVPRRDAVRAPGGRGHAHGTERREREGESV